MDVTQEAVTTQGCVSADIHQSLVKAHEALVTARENDGNRLIEWSYKKDNLRGYLQENKEELGEHAQAIADLFDIVLTRNYTVTVLVEFTATIESERELTEEDFSSYYITPELYWGSHEVSFENSDITDVTIEEDN